MLAALACNSQSKDETKNISARSEIGISGADSILLHEIYRIKAERGNEKVIEFVDSLFSRGWKSEQGFLAAIRAASEVGNLAAQLRFLDKMYESCGCTVKRFYTRSDVPPFKLIDRGLLRISYDSTQYQIERKILLDSLEARGKQ